VKDSRLTARTRLSLETRYQMADFLGLDTNPSSPLAPNLNPNPNIEQLNWTGLGLDKIGQLTTLFTISGTIKANILTVQMMPISCSHWLLGWLHSVLVLTLYRRQPLLVPAIIFGNPKAHILCFAVRIVPGNSPEWCSQGGHGETHCWLPFWSDQVIESEVMGQNSGTVLAPGHVPDRPFWCLFGRPRGADQLGAVICAIAALGLNKDSTCKRMGGSCPEIDTATRRQRRVTQWLPT